MLGFAHSEALWFLWSVVLLPCLCTCCCFSAYIQTLHTNDPSLQAVMQMCSYQKYEKSAVVSAFLLVWQVLRSRWWQALTQPIRCCSVLYLCQFSWADLWSIFRADERFFQDFPLVVETFVWDIFMGQPRLGWSLIACPGWCHSESKALLCCSSCLLWQEQTYGTDPGEPQNEVLMLQTWLQGVSDAAQMAVKTHGILKKWTLISHSLIRSMVQPRDCGQVQTFVIFLFFLVLRTDLFGNKVAL